MNEIDEILSNIDKDDDARLFKTQGADAKRNDEISDLIDKLGSTIDQGEDSRESGTVESVEAEAGPGVEAEGPSSPEADRYDRIRAAGSDDAGMFSMPGSKNWNRREPYMIPVNSDVLRNDLESLQKSFFFVEDPSGQDDLKQRIKQEIVAFLRKPTGHITDSYADFIRGKISVMVENLSATFTMDPDTEKLFIYHLGPLTVYKYIRDDFYQNKYGYCYKYLPGNKAARFFPDEYMKTTVLKWFEENINTLNIAFDSIQKYEEMKKIASRRYYNDLRTFNNRLEQLNLKLGAERSISRMKLLQLKGNQWFGHLNLEIYKRFIGNTIFM
jgi:hypothetical protein